jgi:hypothetical protein
MNITGLGLRLPSTEAPTVPLCRDCRFCQPTWWMLVVPIFNLLPIVRRSAWETATCRHPTSRYRPRWRNYVLGVEPRPRQLDCSSARSIKERCSWEGRHFAARRIPTLVWSIGLSILGYIIVAAYVLAISETVHH